MPNSSWRLQLAQSLTLALYSLEPDKAHWPSDTSKDAPKMDDSLILGSAHITDADEIAQLLTAVDERMSGVSACIYEPRHALESSDGTVLLIACFECGQGHVAGEIFPSSDFSSLAPAAATVFNTLLQKHGVPLSHLAKTRAAK